MPDTKISELTAASAFADSVVPADRGDGTVTNKVRLDAIAALGGGPPASHAASHATGGADAITPASIGAVATSDSRLTDSRVPTLHASSHATGQADQITPASIGAASASHTHTLSAITDAGTAASRAVPASGNATSTQVVLGSDSRLTDSRFPISHQANHRPNGGDWILPEVISATLTSNPTNNYGQPRCDVMYLTCASATTMTGWLAAGNAVNGMVALIVNANASGGAAITLAHESASSSAENRFRSSFGTDVILPADGGSAVVVYHSAISRWRIL